MKWFISLIFIFLQSCGQLPTTIAGPQGPPGISGAPGQNATPITPVQLCGTCQPSYPNQFPEYALCISNELYGVYSANGGFLVLIPPGAYTSDGIGCSCTFTVSPGCEISGV